ncbi:MAG TPA: CBS domain-containing protein [Alphaproteobacteria bacterium]|jgi:CBS domain-containing protein|nr:CBS domain-containing protein [Alphaproteobacteria bacterium]
MNQRHMADLIRDQRPLALPPTATVHEACQQMRQRRVGAVLVVDADRHLLGIFTGRDAVGVLAEARDARTTRLDAVMTPKPDTIGPATTAIEALRRMQDGGYRHLPIVAQGRVAGIVSRGDFKGLEQARLDEETGLWERI